MRKALVVVGLGVIVVLGLLAPGRVCAATWLEYQVQKQIDSQNKVGGQWHVVIVREFGDSEGVKVALYWGDTQGVVEWRLGEEVAYGESDKCWPVQIRSEYGSVACSLKRVTDFGSDPWSWGSLSFTPPAGGVWKDIPTMAVWWGGADARPKGELIYAGLWETFAAGGGFYAETVSPVIDDGVTVFESFPALVLRVGGWKVEGSTFNVGLNGIALLEDVPIPEGGWEGSVDIPVELLEGWNTLSVGAVGSDGPYSKSWRFGFVSGAPGGTISGGGWYPGPRYTQWTGEYYGIDPGDLLEFVEPDGTRHTLDTSGASDGRGSWEIGLYVDSPGVYQLMLNGDVVREMTVLIEGTEAVPGGEGFGGLAESLAAAVTFVKTLITWLPAPIPALIAGSTTLLIMLRILGR